VTKVGKPMFPADGRNAGCVKGDAAAAGLHLVGTAGGQAARATAQLPACCFACGRDGSLHP